LARTMWLKRSWSPSVVGATSGRVSVSGAVFGSVLGWDNVALMGRSFSSDQLLDRWIVHHLVAKRDAPSPPR